MTKRILSENLDLTLDYDAYRITAPVVTVNGNSISQNLSTTGSPVFSSISVGGVANVGTLDVDSISCSGSATVSGSTSLADCSANSITSANGIKINTGGLTISAGGASVIGDLTGNSTLQITNPNTNAPTLDFMDINSNGAPGRLKFDCNANQLYWQTATGGGFPTLRTIFNIDNYGTISSIGNQIVLQNSQTPNPSTSFGTKGAICWDANYLYVCVNNSPYTWKRVALTSF